jgi:stage II sporulation protein AA (anti-sigma F factor antagonist)
VTPRFEARAEPAADRVVRVPVTGEVDLATSDTLFHLLVAVLARDEIQRVEVDLADVTVLDASGIGVLLAARNRARTRGKELRVAGATGLPLTVLETTGVLDVLGGKTVDGSAAARRPGRTDGWGHER